MQSKCAGTRLLLFAGMTTPSLVDYDPCRDLRRLAFAVGIADLRLRKCVLFWLQMCVVDYECDTLALPTTRSGLLLHFTIINNSASACMQRAQRSQ